MKLVYCDAISLPFPPPYSNGPIDFTYQFDAMGKLIEPERATYDYVPGKHFHEPYGLTILPYPPPYEGPSKTKG